MLRQAWIDTRRAGAAGQCTAIQAYRRIVNYSRYRTVGPHTPRPERA